MQETSSSITTQATWSAQIAGKSQVPTRTIPWLRSVKIARTRSRGARCVIPHTRTSVTRMFTVRVAKPVTTYRTMSVKYVQLGPIVPVEPRRLIVIPAIIARLRAHRRPSVKRVLTPGLLELLSAHSVSAVDTSTKKVRQNVYHASQAHSRLCSVPNLLTPVRIALRVNFQVLKDLQFARIVKSANTKMGPDKRLANCA